MTNAPSGLHLTYPQTPASDPEFIPNLVQALLRDAEAAGASDVHLVPTHAGLDMLWRVDGVLHAVDRFEKAWQSRIITRLKVLAGLLTYHSEVPQEGRIRLDRAAVETRVSTFPTVYGEKAVIRLFVGSGSYRRIDELGLPESVRTELLSVLDETGGVLLVTGPAGSGKTTTIYACLREILDKSQGARSLVSLEDPVEVIVPGVSQSQISESTGFTMHTGLRSLMRQDPEVIMVGEIRDRTTAEIVVQASLTGHLVVTTFHAGSAAGAVSRLLDMGIEPYLLRSGLLGIVSQRLVRRLCHCAVDVSDDAGRLGLPVSQARTACGCPDCRQTGYTGRLVLCEMLRIDVPEIGRGILQRQDAQSLQELAEAAGMITQRQRGYSAIEQGVTSPEEIIRVLGSR